MVFLAAWKFWGILPGLPDADLWLLELGTEDHTGWRHRQRCKRTGCDKGKLAFPVDRCGPQRFSAANHGFSQYGNDSLDIACGSAPAIIPEELQNASGLSACSRGLADDFGGHAAILQYEICTCPALCAAVSSVFVAVWRIRSVFLQRGAFCLTCRLCFRRNRNFAACIRYRKRQNRQL